ncbi:hypothetical protein [Methylobacterium sp. Leaf111]|uniref:hypothetical protein n=1 Tax=Methylobacterium sp. Leaf111 TaxID=1736257 RepID=UPI00387E4E5F
MRDAVLVASAQAVEHDEIARYGTPPVPGQAPGTGGVCQRAPAEPQREKGDRPPARRQGRASGRSARGRSPTGRCTEGLALIGAVAFWVASRAP